MNIMKKMIIPAIPLIFLAGCNSAPIQLGNEKYKITHPPVGQTQALEEAQNFCKAHGSSYAEVVFDGSRETVFFCMKQGDTLVDRNAPKVCVGVNNC
jgi:hypothetical protein